ncbi:MAG: Ppx/GppA family phosphatase [Candidatus Solibacter sp.]|nr:Ppx/GppA family phosphatase [Candidatus Solibacter sp.]
MPRYAALDIGSNSVRYMVADVPEPGRLVTVAEGRQVTRLGESVFRTGSVSAEAIASVSGVLARMAAEWRQTEPLAVRAVATAAIRDAANGDEFIEAASRAAGVQIETISGQEEARLIHLGVEARWPHPGERILLIDIGGGSAEVIEASGGVMRTAFSRPLGAVRLQSVFLQSDPPSREELTRLDEFIVEKLAAPARRIERGGFARAIGTSAAASSIVCAANRIPRTRRQEADRRQAAQSQVRRLYQRLSAMTLDERRSITGIGPRRAEIIVPGVAVLLRAMETFDVQALAYCTAGVRDGVIRDLAERGVGRERARLNRENRALVEQFARRFGVEIRHARKVACFARELFEMLRELHQLPLETGRLLEAAAYLRDAGHLISDSSHHRHSQYIVQNSDLAGFTALERTLVALLCRYHRKSMPGARHAEFQALAQGDKKTVLYLAPLLRLADALDRSRDQRVESLTGGIRNGQLVLTLRSEKDTGLERWAVESAVQDFAQVYGKRLVVNQETP